MKVLGVHKPLIGVIHLLPLPGSPGYAGKMDRVVERALADARAYLKGGVGAFVVENYGDLPFHAGAAGPETVAALTAVAVELRQLGDLDLGVNVLRSDGPAAMAIAVAVGARFVRVNVLAGAMLTDQGIIQGCAAQVMRLRAVARARVQVWGDLLVKHAVPLAPMDAGEAARDLAERAQADAVILTGQQTGAAAAPGELLATRKALPRTPLVVGSGVSASNLERYWELADAFIVGPSLKKGARTTAAVDEGRVRRLVAARDALSRRRPHRHDGSGH